MVAPQNPLEPVAEVIKNLLRHQYPYDLSAIRRKVVNDYNSEADAKANMECYCTDEYYQKEFAAYWTSRKAGEDWLKNNGFTLVLPSVCPNDK